MENLKKREKWTFLDEVLMKKTLEGLVLKGIGGFYYINTNCGLYECKARGVFRKKGISPVVGDYVLISIVDEEKKKGSLDEIQKRKNCLLRPVVSNVDNMVIVTAAKSPDFDFFFVDKMCALSELYGITPIIVINKTDLCDGKKYGSVYENIGYNVIYTKKDDEASLNKLKNAMKNGINVLAGFSGVGKSTLINGIFGDEARETGEISTIERGRHTTRHSELFLVDENTYIADTPGFSSLEINFKIDNLSELFVEFKDFSDCRFSSCNHIKESGCSVIEAVENKKIAQSRYDSYLAIYDKIKDIKDWNSK